jgi:protein arginine kinase activator
MEHDHQMDLGLCEECHSQPANVHVTQISSDETVVFHLCEECAAKRGISITINDQSQQETQQPSQPEGPVCERCGLAFSEFRASGSLGCSDCYTAFEAEIDKILVEMHGARAHRGKGTLRRSGGDLKTLKAQLHSAIRNEEFEEAAQLRDAIRTISANRDSQ